MKTKFQREIKLKRVTSFSKNKIEYNEKTEIVKQVHKDALWKVPQNWRRLLTIPSKGSAGPRMARIGK